MSGRSRWILWCLLALGVAMLVVVVGRLVLDTRPRPIEYQDMQKG